MLELSLEVWHIHNTITAVARLHNDGSQLCTCNGYV